ncbi:DNA topoisomerase 3 [bacterium]|nr:DNA topoisomerase 3 [bacterium]
MAKSLIIAEKPSVAKDIAKALGGFKDQKEFLESDSHVITWAVGHLLEFVNPEDIDPKYKAWKLEDLPIIPSSFKLQPKDKCKERIRVISRLMKRDDIDCLVNACDAGREGELIFRELIQYCKCKKTIKRLWLQSMTLDAIRAAFQNLRPGAEYENLYQAAQCRSEADWLIGINATRALTRRLKTRSEKVSWSAGRVQTPTLAMLCAREAEIMEFRPTPFWRIKASFAAPASAAAAFELTAEEHKEGSLSPLRLRKDAAELCAAASKTAPHTYEATWFDPKYRRQDDDPPKREEWITDPQRAEEILLLIASHPQAEAFDRHKSESIASPRLFDLTTLQREANSRFGMSAKSTLAAAQSLYESHKLITYPRTSSKCLPTDYTGEVRKIFAMLASYAGRPSESVLDFGLYAKAAAQLQSEEKLRNYGKIFDNSAITDHFAIIPTLQRVTKALRSDEAKIYNLILRRFLAAFYPAAVKVKLERITELKADREVLSFRTRSSYLSDEGWMAVYGREAGEEAGQALPALAAQDNTRTAVCNKEAVSKSEQTQPPARITEARLLSLMENAGKQVSDEELSSALKDMGLGTPATRAEIIEALITRGYVERTDKALKVTSKGLVLIDVLKRIECRRLASPELTGEMEFNLNQVEHGAYKRAKYMHDIEDYTKEIIERARSFDYDEIYGADEPLGLCPLCGKHQVYEKMRFYACEANRGEKDSCEFLVWKDKNGRYIDRRTMQELLSQGSTDFIEGFRGSASGRGAAKTYKAKLRLNNGAVELETENGTVEQSAVSLPVDGEALGTCPFDENCRVIETPSIYACQQVCMQNGRHSKGFSLPRIVCQRQISHEELAYYLEHRRTEFLDNFISKYNKPFTGAIILNERTGRYSFEFAPRASKKTAASAAGTSAAANAADAETAAKPAAKRTRKAAADAEAEAKPAARRTRKAAAEAETKPAARRTRKIAAEAEAESKPAAKRTRKAKAE